MTIVGISLSTLVEIFVVGWVTGVLTVVGIMIYWSKRKKKD